MDISDKGVNTSDSVKVAEPVSVNVAKASDPTLSIKITRIDLLQSTGILYAASTIIHTDLVHAKDGDDNNVVAVPVTGPSKKTTPWQMILPTVLTPLQKPSHPLDPAPQKLANTSGDGHREAGRLEHLFWDLVTGKEYSPYTFPDLANNQLELFAVQFDDWLYHPDYPRQIHWGFQGDPSVVNQNESVEDEKAFHDRLDSMIPSEIITAHYGQPILCRIHNRLPQIDGFGLPACATHLHNLHCGSESDGFPGDFYGPNITKQGPTLTENGEFLDHLYINLKAGFRDLESWPDGLGDPAEALGTLFYHDHTMNFTGPNVYRGLAGFYLLFDDVDTGNETSGLRLPSGNYDYPFNIGDRRFDREGNLVFDQFDPDGTLGDKIVINGRIEPVWKVKARRYRMRLLNSGPSRRYDFAIVDEKNILQEFLYIANDGNLLENPLAKTNISLAVAERADIWMDFSKYQGKVLYLVNRLEQTSTRKSDKLKLPGQQIMRIDIAAKSPGDPDDHSVALTTKTLLRHLPASFKLTEAQLVDRNTPVRRWVFERKGGVWVVNGNIFDVENAAVEVERDSAEVWELVNKSGGWMHPIHIHFEEGRVLSKVVDGKKVPVPDHEKGRKDIYLLEPNSITRVYLQFRDFTGKYVMHCHNMIHEDHAMMVRWDIV